MLGLLLFLFLAGAPHSPAQVLRPAAAAPVRIAPVLGALELHLSNLTVLDRLPALEPLPAPLSGGPSLASLAPSERLNEYLSGLAAEARGPPEEQAARDLLLAAVLEPGRLGELQAGLRAAGGERAEAVAGKLGDWSRGHALKASDRARLEAAVAAGPAGSADEARSRLERLFEGAAPYAAAVDAGAGRGLEAGPAPRASRRREVDTGATGRLEAEAYELRPGAADLEGWFGSDGKAPRREDGVVVETFENLGALLSRYRGLGLDLASQAAMAAHAVKDGRDGRWLIPHQPATWKVLGGRQKEDVAASAKLKTRTNEGVRLSLSLRPGDDLAAVARKYAFGRPAAPIERYLRLKTKGASGPVALPLQSLLPSSIRKSLESFETCSGANCVNAALSAHQAGPAAGRPAEGEDLLAALKGSYERIGEVEPRPGDLLIYTGDAGEFIHAAVYLGDGYVYTKNGPSRQNGYIFQDIQATEAYFFPKGEFKRKVFRPKS